LRGRLKSKPVTTFADSLSQTSKESVDRAKSDSDLSTSFASIRTISVLLPGSCWRNPSFLGDSSFLYAFSVFLLPILYLADEVSGLSFSARQDGIGQGDYLCHGPFSHPCSCSVGADASGLLFMSIAFVVAARATDPLRVD